MKRLLLVSAAALVGLSALLSPLRAHPTQHSVTTSVTQPVEACGYGCCFSGRMKATFRATLNGNGTADVGVTFRPMGLGGPCGNITGSGAVSVATVPIGTATGVAGGTWYVHPVYIWVLTSFVVNADGTVTNVGMGLYLFIIPPV